MVTTDLTVDLAVSEQAERLGGDETPEGGAGEQF